MSKLTSYRLLSFDVYGTLVEWERGLLSALEPLFQANDATIGTTLTREHVLNVYHKYENAEQVENPTKPYSEILATILPRVAQGLGFKNLPSASDAQKFGASIGTWPAFPDTVAALKRLKRHFKLVILSNVDRQGISNTLAGPLATVEFDAVLTAQDIGSYKPDLRNFEYMLDYVEKNLGVAKAEVLQTAHSQTHDCYPAREMGIKSVWIERPGSVIGAKLETVWDWKFDTMGDMADALEKELKEEGKM